MESPKKLPFQYTLADMIILITVVAMFFSIIESADSKTPIMGLTGIGTFGSLVMLIFWPRNQRFLRVCWRVIFVIYLLLFIIAIIAKV